MGSHRTGRSHGGYVCAVSTSAIVTAIGAVLFANDPQAAADDTQGAQLAATCASCHIPVGKGAGIPSIAGLDEASITRAMLAYKASERPSHVMHAVALSLSEEELASIARYLATQKKERNPQ